MTHHTISWNLSKEQLSTIFTISHHPRAMTQNKITIETFFGSLDLLETLQIVQRTATALSKWQILSRCITPTGNDRSGVEIGFNWVLTEKLEECSKMTLQQKTCLLCCGLDDFFCIKESVLWDIPSGSKKKACFTFPSCWVFSKYWTFLSCLIQEHKTQLQLAIT